MDNRPGAGGALGAELAAKAPPDGYTIWIGQTANLAIGPALRKQSLYDPVRDFAPITMIQKSPSAIVVAAGSPLTSVKDVIAAAKKNPQGITYGSAGVGTAGHINGYLINVAGRISGHPSVARRSRKTWRSRGARSDGWLTARTTSCCLPPPPRLCAAAARRLC